MDKLRMKSSDASDGNVAKVVVYAKLQRSFHIPTPVGNYAPVWAIAMNKGEVKHIFFIAETKGLLLSMQLNAIPKRMRPSDCNDNNWIGVASCRSVLR